MPFSGLETGSISMYTRRRSGRLLGMGRVAREPDVNASNSCACVSVYRVSERLCNATRAVASEPVCSTWSSVLNKRGGGADQEWIQRAGDLGPN